MGYKKQQAESKQTKTAKMTDLKKHSHRNPSRKSTCDSKVELVEYYVSDVKYCNQHGRTEDTAANEPAETDCSVFGVLKRCFTCKSYEPLSPPDDIEEKMLVTIVECQTHPEPTSQCLNFTGRSRRGK